MNNFWRDLGFYFVEYHQAILAYIPPLLSSVVFLFILLVAVYGTKKSVDKHWLKFPEKLQRTAKVKLYHYEKDIERLENERDALKKENVELKALVKAGIEQIHRAGNILGGERG